MDAMYLRSIFGTIFFNNYILAIVRLFIYILFFLNNIYIYDKY